MFPFICNVLKQILSCFWAMYHSLKDCHGVHLQSGRTYSLLALLCMYCEYWCQHTVQCHGCKVRPASIPILQILRLYGRTQKYNISKE